MDGAGISALPETVGLSGLPDPMGEATAALEARRRQQVQGAGYDPDQSLYGRYSAMLGSALGPTIAERARAAADAMRRGDMGQYQKLATDLASDFGGFLGSIKGVGGLPEILARWKAAGLDVYVSQNPKDGSLTLNKLIVPKDKRSSGMGTQFMEDLVDFADRQRVRATLTPDTAFGGSSESRLRAFYRRFGFVDNKGRARDFSISDGMYREPKRID